MKMLQCLVVAVLMSFSGHHYTLAQTGHQHGTPAQPPAIASHDAVESKDLAGRITAISEELAAGAVTPDRLQALSAELLTLLPLLAAESAAPTDSEESSERAGMMGKMRGMMSMQSMHMADMMSGETPSGETPSGETPSCKMMSGGMASQGRMHASPMMSGEMMAGRHRRMMPQSSAGNAHDGAAARHHPRLAGLLPAFDSHADPVTMQMYGEILSAVGDILTRYGQRLAESQQPLAPTGAE
jgi:hypothetical protein